MRRIAPWISIVMLVACGDIDGGHRAPDADAENPPCGVCVESMVCRDGSASKRNDWLSCEEAGGVVDIEGAQPYCETEAGFLLCVTPPHRAATRSGWMLPADPPCPCFGQLALVRGVETDLPACFVGSTCE